MSDKCEECGWLLPDHRVFCSKDVEAELGKQLDEVEDSDEIKEDK